MNKFEGYTQLPNTLHLIRYRCFIRMSMNKFEGYTQHQLNGKVRGICCFIRMSMNKFEGYTQPKRVYIAPILVVLSGCQ